MRSVMMKFKGKPSELRAFTRELCERYGDHQKLIAVYIMLGKEWDLKNERI